MLDCANTHSESNNIPTTSMPQTMAKYTRLQTLAGATTEVKTIPDHALNQLQRTTPYLFSTEIIVNCNALTPTQQDTTTNPNPYLRSKWGITPNPAFPRTTAPATATAKIIALTRLNTLLLYKFHDII